MWKKRETHIFDIYKNNQASDDFLLPLTTATVNTNGNHGNTIYSSVNMSKSHPSLLFHSNDSNSEKPLTKKKSSSSTLIYAGNDFDVFGKEQSEEHFAPLYSIEQFTPTKLRKERYLKGEVLLRTEQEFKRGQVEAMLQNTIIIKKRRTTNITGPEQKDFFLESTASIKTPAASMFVEDSDEHNEDDDLAYY
jgi:hypothetical protein